MARARRSSEVLETARQRLAALQEFTPKPDFGPGLTLEAFEAAVSALSAEQDAYNGDVSTLDDKTNLFDAHERSLQDLSSRILLAVKASYGPDSSEYERVGGVRLRDRKRPGRESKTPAA